jgi:hypothetical protein
MQVKGDRMALAAMQVLKGEGTEQLERVLKELERENKRRNTEKKPQKEAKISSTRKNSNKSRQQMP